MDARQAEAAKRYPDPFLSHDPSRAAFIAGAEWARKEAAAAQDAAGECPASVTHSSEPPGTVWWCEKGSGHAGHHSAYIHGGHLWAREPFRVWDYSADDERLRLNMDAIVDRMLALEEEATKAAIIAELRRQGYLVLPPYQPSPDSEEEA